MIRGVSSCQQHAVAGVHEADGPAAVPAETLSSSWRRQKLMHISHAAALSSTRQFTAFPSLCQQQEAAPATPKGPVKTQSNSAATSASTSAKQDRIVLYRGAYMRPFRMLVRFKIFQLVGVASLAIPINTFLVEVHMHGLPSDSEVLV